MVKFRIKEICGKVKVLGSDMRSNAVLLAIKKCDYEELSWLSNWYAKVRMVSTDLVKCESFSSDLLLTRNCPGLMNWLNDKAIVSTGFNSKHIKANHSELYGQLVILRKTDRHFILGIGNAKHKAKYGINRTSQVIEIPELRDRLQNGE